MGFFLTLETSFKPYVRFFPQIGLGQPILNFSSNFNLLPSTQIFNHLQKVVASLWQLHHHHYLLANCMGMPYMGHL